MKKYAFSTLVMLLLGIFFISACTQQPVQEQKQANRTVLIAAILPLTEKNVDAGEELQALISLALEDANKKENEKNMTFAMMYFDSKCQKDVAKEHVKTVKRQNIPVIIGGVCDEETEALATAAEKERIVFITPTSTINSISDLEYAFRTTFSNKQEGQFTAGILFHKYKWTKAAVLYERTQTSTEKAKAFTTLFEGLGGSIVAEESFATNETTFAIPVSRIKQAKPQVVYILTEQEPQLANILITIDKQKAGFKKVIGNQIVKDTFVRAYQKETNNSITIELAFEQTETLKDILETYKDRTGKEHSSPVYAATTYDAVSLVIESIQKIGLKSTDIRNYLYTFEHWQGAVREVSIDTNGDASVGFKEREIVS